MRISLGLPDLGLMGQSASGIVSALSLAKQSFKEWIDPTISATITGSPVSIITYPVADGFTTRKNFQRSTLASPADRPSITASRLVFDGTADLLDGSAGYTYVSTVTPADPFYAEAGKGPTTVGLARVSDGTWWMGHFGKKNESTAGVETFDGSLIHYSADFSTITQEIRFQDLSLAGVGIQGVAIDAQDGMIWCADPGNGKIYKIDPTGPTVSKNYTFAGANGLAYDSINNQLLVCLANSVTVTRLNKATGATISTFTIRDITNNTLDMLYFDGSYGAAGALYTTGRDNGTNGRIIKYDLNSGATPVKAWSISEVKSIEAFVPFGGIFYICSDEYYHNQTAAVNRVVAVTADESSADYGTRLILAGICKIAATPAATVALLTGGDALTSGTPNRKGIGLFFSTTANQFRLITRNMALQASINWALTSTTTEFLYYIDIDTVANTATLYVNGTLVSAQTDATNLTGSIPHLLWTLGASYENSALPSRFSNTTHGGFIVSTDSLHRAEIEGYLAWQTSNTSLLPSDHTYKNSAPT